MGVANGERTIQFITGSQRADRLRSNLRVQPHFVEIVSGSKNRKYERQHGDSEEQEDGVPESAQQVRHQDSARGPERSMRGTAARSSRVISFSGCFRTWSGRPFSTILPLLITAISSARCAAIAISWVMKR